MQYFSRGLIALIVVLGLAGITYLWWQKQQMQIQAPDCGGTAAIDTAGAVSLYLRIYPTLQKAYASLGAV